MSSNNLANNYSQKYKLPLHHYENSYLTTIMTGIQIYRLVESAVSNCPDILPPLSMAITLSPKHMNIHGIL